MTGKEIIAFIQTNKLQNYEFSFDHPIIDENKTDVCLYRLKDNNFTSEMVEALEKVRKEDREEFENTYNYTILYSTYDFTFLRFHKVNENLYIAKTREECSNRPRFYVCIATIYQHCIEGINAKKYFYNPILKTFMPWEK